MTTELKLPPLPKHLVAIDQNDDEFWGELQDHAWDSDYGRDLKLNAPLFTAGQMEAYARAAIEANKRAESEPSKSGPAGSAEPKKADGHFVHCGNSHKSPYEQSEGSAGKAGELPPLPFSPLLVIDWVDKQKSQTLYTADQMREYALAAIASAAPPSAQTAGQNVGESPQTRMDARSSPLVAQTVAQEREAFEKWVRRESSRIDLTPSKDLFCRDGRFPATYWSEETETAWRAWANKPAALAAPAQLSDEQPWQPMLTAPLDGTEVELTIRHNNWIYASGKDREQWEQIVRAKWIDFNGGGWTWHGMAGMPVGWRALLSAAQGKESGNG